MAEATARYYEALKTPEGAPAVEYLSRRRGLTGDSAQFFRLGVVADPLPGHEQYAGRLAIPYLTPAGVTTIRFRRLDVGEPPYEGPKFLSLPGDQPRIFNPAALMRPESYIVICEGEPDTITAHQAGLPAVGIQGVSAWRPYFARCFKGYASVYILADSDDKGQGIEFAERVAAEVANARIVPMPDGHDVNSYVLASGAQALLERLDIH